MFCFIVVFFKNYFRMFKAITVISIIFVLSPENTEAQRGETSYFWSHSQLEAKPGIQLSSPGSQHAAP